MRGPRLVSLAVALAAAGAAAGQSLGELARQEQERRAKSAPRKSAPSFTDADLASRRGAPAAAASPSPSPSSSPSPSASASPSPAAEDESTVRRLKEAEWRIRFANARERISLAEAACWHTVIETVFVSGIPVQQPVRKFEESEELRNARRALEDLEEEFRRTGLPAGWAR